MNLGIFNGLWSGVSNTIGQGIAYSTNQYNVKSGEYDKQRLQELELQRIKAKQQETTLIVVVVVVMLILVVFIIGRKKN